MSIIDWEKAECRTEQLSDLWLDLNVYPRERPDPEVVASYAKAKLAGAEFPAIKVALYQGRKVIVDGGHRVGSHKQLKLPTIECYELPFTSAVEIFAEAVRCNNMHGKAFNPTDVKRNIKRLRQLKFEVEDIVRLLHVPAAEIRNVTAEPIVKLRTPWGSTKNVFQSPTPSVAVDPDSDVCELIKFKNNLQAVINYANKRKRPIEELVVKELVTSTRAALGRLEKL